MYYPEVATFKDTNWGSLWWIVVAAPETVTGATGQSVTLPERAFLVESVGPAAIVQAQLVLQEGTMASDRTFDGTLLSSDRTRPDGIIGPQTLRQLWTYFKLLMDRGLYRRNQAALDAIRTAAVNRTSPVPPMILSLMLRATYHIRRLIRRPGQQEYTTEAGLLPVATAGRLVTLFQSPGGLPDFLRPLSYPVTTDVIRALPTFARIDRSMPAPPAVMEIPASAIDSAGSMAPGAHGPWTLRAGQAAPLNAQGQAPVPGATPEPVQPPPSVPDTSTGTATTASTDQSIPPKMGAEESGVVPARSTLGSLAASASGMLSRNGLGILGGVSLITGIGLIVIGAMGDEAPKEQPEGHPKHKKEHG